MRAHHGVGPVTAAAVAELMKRKAATLRMLDLSNNALGPEGAKSIASGLGSEAVLETLHLGGNRIGDAGASDLATALTGVSLYELDLPHNNIGSVGVEALALAIEGNDAVITVELQGNPGASLPPALRLAASLVERLPPSPAEMLKYSIP